MYYLVENLILPEFRLAFLVGLAHIATHTTLSVSRFVMRPNLF